MYSPLPIGIQAVISKDDPLYARFVKYAKRNLQREYEWCGYCGQPLEESGMRVRGELVVSAKTCRNPLCPICGETLNPEAHQRACEDVKKGRAS